MADNALTHLQDLQVKLNGSFNASDAGALLALIDATLAVPASDGHPDQIRDAMQMLQRASEDTVRHGNLSTVRVAAQQAWPSGQSAEHLSLAISSSDHSVARVATALGVSAKTLGGLADGLESALKKDQFGREQLWEARARIDLDPLFSDQDSGVRRAQEIVRRAVASMVTAAQEAETAHKAAAGVLQQLTVQAPARRAKALAAQRGAAPSAVDLTLAADAGHIVYDKNFPDPGVLKVGNTYYAYGTNSPDANVQLLTSTDLEHWTEAGNALPQVGPWARSGRTWAPEVMPLPNGQFAMFYTAQSAATGHQAVGVAVANGPAGPFVDNSPQPLLSGAGDTLDASPFRSPIDGRMYVQWKDGATATILSQQLSPDGLQVTGPQVPLLSNDQPWQSNIVEAPQMHVHDGQHYLFYSGNSFDNPGYGVGYAMCDGPLGPCRDAPENPILHQKGDALGPGHSTLITDSNGDDRLLYHAWHPDALNGPPGRVLWLDRVEWVNGKPVVRGPAG